MSRFNITADEPPTIDVFFKAVVNHWKILMSGSALLIVIGIFEKLVVDSFSWPVYLLVFIVLVFVSCFLAWKEERIGRQDLALKQSELHDDLADGQIDLKLARAEILILRQQLAEQGDTTRGLRDFKVESLKNILQERQRLFADGYMSLTLHNTGRLRELNARIDRFMREHLGNAYVQKEYSVEELESILRELLVS